MLLSLLGPIRESFGEDIAQTESEKSVDDDTYEGSFINDSDPGHSSSSAHSSFEGTCFLVWIWCAMRTKLVYNFSNSLMMSLSIFVLC